MITDWHLWMYFGLSNHDCQMVSVPATVIAGRVFISGIFWLARRVILTIILAMQRAMRKDGSQATHFAVEKE